MIISIDPEEEFDKILYPLMIKNTQLTKNGKELSQSDKGHL